MPVFACSSCRHPLSVADAHAGRAVRCPACRAVLQAPTVSVPPRPSATVSSKTEPTAAAGPAALPFLAPPEQPDELGRLGPYRVLRELGAGGMGLVLLADDPGLGRQVAVKVL